MYSDVTDVQVLTLIKYRIYLNIELTELVPSSSRIALESPALRIERLAPLPPSTALERNTKASAEESESSEDEVLSGTGSTWSGAAIRSEYERKPAQWESRMPSSECAEYE